MTLAECTDGDDFNILEYLKEMEYKLEDPNLPANEREEIIQHINICRAEYLDYCLNKLKPAA